MASDDTIVAIATATGRAAIGIVRVSGARAPAIAESLLGRSLAPRLATYAAFKDAQARIIDQGLALFFPAPHSYTGEAMLELQSHGSPVALSQLMSRCVELGARLAEPGEFTRRAFLNDKLDLAQAEAVADVIAASSQAAARAAHRTLSGDFSKAVRALMQDLVQTRVILEAGLDFPEEELDVMSAYGIRARIEQTEQALTVLESRAKQGRLLAEGVRVAIIGVPNAGKSSILNRLAEEDVAIVADVPGTTRDTVTAQASLEGVRFLFVDTAGIRDSKDVVEQLGIARSHTAGETADVLLLVVDLAQNPEASADVLSRFSKHPNTVVALNKTDLRSDPANEVAKRFANYPTVSISALTGQGFEALKETLLRASGWRTQEQSEDVFVAHARQLEALEEAHARVLAGLEMDTASPELIAEELRYATNALGKITGAVTSDDVLGEIFARFCIGK